MSFVSDTREAFRNDERDYETDYDRKYSYSRRERDRYDAYDGYDESDTDYDEDYGDDYEEEKSWNPLKKFFENRRAKKAERLAEEEAYEEQRSAGSGRAGASIRYNAFRETNIDVEMAVFYPKHFDDSDKIVEAVQQGKLALFIFEDGETARNAEVTSNGTARRIVDYVGGAAKGMGCGFGRLSSGIFCIAPKNVKIPQDRGRRSY